MKKILLIDDDVLVLKTLTNILSREGYEAHAVKSGKEAQIWLEKNRPDLLICDIRMPEDDGIQVISKLKGANDFDTPFLFMTGYASEDAPVDALNLGASGYIFKPLDVSQLMESIQNALSPKEDMLEIPTAFDICKQIKTMLNDYYEKHENEVAANFDLNKLFAEFEKKLNLLEKEYIKADEDLSA